GIPALFEAYSAPDKKESSRYVLYADQGGLSLPDREYYLAESFAETRTAYRAHLGRLFGRAGVPPEGTEGHAHAVLALETELARASRSRTELRDEEKNYHRRRPEELTSAHPTLSWAGYLAELRVPPLPYLIVGQPEFFDAVDRLLRERPLREWKIYLRWQLLRSTAPGLPAALEEEHFDFFHRKLLGQAEPEPRWKRAGLVVDSHLGEALGQLYVERHFPPEARQRMERLLDDLRSVFRDRLASLPWMTEATRKSALAKFERFTTKIGHPERFRDYSSIRIDAGDFLGNIFRTAEFETRRQVNRIGGPVDRAEWGMTPPTVNAYFSPTLNEIVFPAGILQPPFFDVEVDDAVNYGGIGAVIGHEITHGYDDQGRRYDAEGNLRDWWTEVDAREFESRALEVVKLYGSLEAAPGLFVNGELTLGENLADLGGLSLAYEALERRLARDPGARRRIDGFTPEQRFFLSWAQCWRLTIREPEMRRRLTIDPHAPGPIRAAIPALLHPAFRDAFPSEDPTPEVPRLPLTIW
ncbi:MAG: M13 family metallopeptidase, partial [Thermoplasmata archaeon]